MTQSIIQQELESRTQLVPIKGVGSHVRILYDYHVEEAIQKSVEKAEKRIDEEFKENYSANGCKIVAKQIIRDVFGEGKNDK